MVLNKCKMVKEKKVKVWLFFWFMKTDTEQEGNLKGLIVLYAVITDSAARSTH